MLGQSYLVIIFMESFDRKPSVLFDILYRADPRNSEFGSSLYASTDHWFLRRLLADRPLAWRGFSFQLCPRTAGMSSFMLFDVDTHTHRAR